MMMFAALLLLMAFLRFGPDIPTRKALNHYLVERPVNTALRLERHHFVFICIAAALFLLGGEIVLMFGSEFVLIFAADVALYLDIVVVSALASSIAHVRGAARVWRRKLDAVLRLPQRRSAKTRRATRARRTPPVTKPANDDDDDQACACQMARHPMPIAA